jgi:adenylate kinase family enzyme
LRRVVVLGCAGTGKTRFARTLGAAIGAPAVVLDDIWRFDEGPEQLDRFRVLMVGAHAGDAWISDGNFAAASFDLRLPRADHVVWLERSRWLRLWRASRRVFRPGERHRPADLGKVFIFIWNFDRINRPRIEAALKAHGPNVPVTRLRTDAETEAFLNAAGAVEKAARRG